MAALSLFWDGVWQMPQKKLLKWLKKGEIGET